MNITTEQHDAELAAWRADLNRRLPARPGRALGYLLRGFAVLSCLALLFAVVAGAIGA